MRRVNAAAVLGGAGQLLQVRLDGEVQIAFLELSPANQQKITNILPSDADFKVFPGACTWADIDKHKPNTPQNGRVDDHFINVPRTLQAITTNDCGAATASLFTAIQSDSDALKPGSGSTGPLGGEHKALEFVEPKSASALRVLPLPALVLATRKTHRARQNEARLQLGPDWHDEGLVFSNGLGKPLEPRTLSRRFKQVLKDAKLPGMLRLRDCRHFAATAVIADGTDVRTVAGLLGHALTLRTYAHVVSEAARKASDRMGALAQG